MAPHLSLAGSPDFWELMQFQVYKQELLKCFFPAQIHNTVQSGGGGRFFGNEIEHLHF